MATDDAVPAREKFKSSASAYLVHIHRFRAIKWFIWKVNHGGQLETKTLSAAFDIHVTIYRPTGQR
jgi:hypothetical protein